MARPSLKPAEIETALRAMGMVYSRRERQQVAAVLDDQIAAAELRRGLVFDNAAPPAGRFDPRLPGFTMPRPPRGVSCPPVSAPLPAQTAEIAHAPLAHLSHWIATGRLTSRRLTEIYLDRIAAQNPALHCFAAVATESALTEAEARDGETARGMRRGPLHGIPYGLKDLFDTAGLVTGWGAEPYANRTPDSDAAVVRRLRAAGAVLIGKTAVGALAYGDIWYGGICRNPWNPAEGSSGSSAGSASAVAAGLCGFAIGTETLGSIVSPSERCGTTGLRPTFGRVSRAGGMALCWSLDKVGPIARGVTDCALVLDAINGADPADRDSIEAPFGARIGQVPKGLRLGMIKGSAQDAPAGFGAVLAALGEMGLEPVEVELPDLPYDTLNALLLAEAAAAFEDLTLSDRDDLLTWQENAAWPNTMRAARLLSAVDHVQLDRLRWRVMQVMDAVFAEVDVLVGRPFAGPMLVVTNFTGHPCLHMRAGFGREKTRAGGTLGGSERRAPAGARGLFRVPHGVSLWAGLFREDLLVQLGAALESRLGVRAETPPAA